ncbi:MAG: hypothetical protein ACI8T1_004409 [Verrucomicrobiales bacterium]|jgi:hypothetical protein
MTNTHYVKGQLDYDLETTDDLVIPWAENALG